MTSAKFKLLIPFLLGSLFSMAMLISKDDVYNDVRYCNLFGFTLMSILIISLEEEDLRDQPFEIIMYVVSGLLIIVNLSVIFNVI